MASHATAESETIDLDPADIHIRASRRGEVFRRKLWSFMEGVGAGMIFGAAIVLVSALFGVGQSIGFEVYWQIVDRLF